ncbi:hydroxymethylpyrimidine ABC transporter substrate-binding protein [Klebsiella pneumoniae]|jgi:NitT/TauT family transport system substrate-binding protein|nr:hydroxymethylpyrimidine ABC transporter substrate-binding protein [Klebsiella pneumoniae]SXY50890.1 hydroxymethylpyrimidine ABC transporter substrate-binding protein [Klebsiella pneumoniae]VTN97150.1 hydroxymethylpyrimidine ABC transporter substrate-binding protein [Klebsiella pneumoniae]
MAKFVRASMEGWVSYLKDPAPGNALIKQDNPKMTDDLLAWGVTQIREHHLIDGGDAASQGWGTMTDARWQKTRDFMVSAGLLAAATDWKQAYTTEFVQAMQVKP